MCSYNVLVAQVACGHAHTHLLSREGYVYSMGYNSQGVLGLSKNEHELHHVSAPQMITGLSQII